MIVQTYNYLNDSGVTTYFGVGRPPKDIVKEKGIHYFPYVMPYEKYLQFVINTNCIVEILQDGTTGYTLRTWEALAFNKKLLTNNPEIINAEFTITNNSLILKILRYKYKFYYRQINY